ncbi:ribosomal-processing cysteine protease Prp [Cohnella pontilimi]|uniref:Ribosomal processing cysteine protease Prp n=1 Tax=Cohnella pontilimi TaxID=2564100 RepID=A0A4U0F9J8_9BACL|nr:ribosomal-processing cysteine protease Prp [Cohnella pontilimi]TJY41436.1 ribosomal-processing cysteine protease Prp [Cohnella pontilimi]
MITVTIERSKQGRIRRFSVTGHAMYDDPGKDIVCAGVSAVTVGAVNAVEKLTGLVPKAEMREGWLTAEAPYSENRTLDGQAQLLLEGMIAALESIADEYAKYVKIKQIFS